MKIALPAVVPIPKAKLSTSPKSIKLKIILARAIVGFPRLILLEDNFKQLPELDKERFLNYIFGSDKKWTIMAVSNDKEIASKFEKVLVLDQGGQLGFDSLSNLSNESWFNQIFLK